MTSSRSAHTYTFRIELGVSVIPELDKRLNFRPVWVKKQDSSSETKST